MLPTHAACVDLMEETFMAKRTIQLLTLLAFVVLSTTCGPPATLAPPSAYRSEIEAMRAYEDALKRNPRDARAHAWLGDLLLRAGRVEEGMGHLARATEIDSSFTDAFVLLGAHLEASGRFPEALRVYDSAVRGNPSVRHLFERRQALQERRVAALRGVDTAVFQLSQGRPDEALLTLRPLVGEIPDDPRAFELIARASLDLLPSLLAYDERKACLTEASRACAEAMRRGSTTVVALAAVVDSLSRNEEDCVSQAREKVEEGTRTFSRDLCLQQRAPHLTLVNRKGYDVTLDLRFTGGATQWVVVADQATLRASPSRDGERRGFIPRGSPVWVRRQGPEGFLNVISAQGEGWVARSVVDRASLVSVTIRNGSTARLVLGPGTAQYRLGHGIRTIAEGVEEFSPYVCYSWG